MSALRFGMNNAVELATITSVPAAVLSADNLKNDWRARVAAWNDFTNTEIVIEGTLDESARADFFSIPGSNLTEDARVKLELYADVSGGVDLVQMDFESISHPIPLGIWRAGVDGYGEYQRVAMGNIHTKWFDSTIEWRRFKLRIEHGYSTAAPVANTIPRQDGSGIVSLEAESADTTVVGSNSFITVSDGSASGGTLLQKTGPTFYWNALEGPQASFVFTAADTGAHDLWARVKTSSSSNSIYTSFAGSNALHILSDSYTAWTWVKLRTISLTSETDHTLTFSARDFSFSMDKIVIQPAGDAAPTGTGPAVSAVGTEGSSDTVALRMLMIGEKVQMGTNFSHGNTIQFLSDPDLQETASGFVVPGKQQQGARRMVMALSQMSEADRLLLAELEISLAGKPFLVSAYPSASEWVEQAHTMLANFSKSLNYTHRHAHLFRTQLNLSEV